MLLPSGDLRWARRSSYQICGHSRDRPLSSVRQTDDYQIRPTPGPTITDQQTTAIQGVMRINHPDMSDSPVKLHGIMRCSVIQP